MTTYAETAYAESVQESEPEMDDDGAIERVTRDISETTLVDEEKIEQGQTGDTNTANESKDTDVAQEMEQVELIKMSQETGTLQEVPQNSESVDNVVENSSSLDPPERTKVMARNFSESREGSSRSKKLPAGCILQKDGSISIDALRPGTGLYGMKRIISDGFHVDTPFIFTGGDTGYAIHEALLAMDMDWLDFLLGSGVDFTVRQTRENNRHNNFKPLQKLSPLQQALDLKNVTAVEKLLNAGAPVEHDPLLLLVLSLPVDSQLHIATLLVSKGADANKTNPFGLTPLCAAVHWGNLEMIVFLIKNGADVNKSVDLGTRWGTPLHCAIDREKPILVKTLLEHNAATDVKASIFTAWLRGSIRFGETKYETRTLTPIELAEQAKFTSTKARREILHLLHNAYEIRLNSSLQGDTLLPR
jgi:hypothetical protein